MYKKITLLINIFFLLGCAPKIENINKYHPIIAQKAVIFPSVRDLNNKPNIIIYSKNNNFYEKKAKEALENLLINSNYVNLLNRNTTINEEIKLAENAKATNSNLNQSDFIITEDITPKTYNENYIPPKYYKNKKGKIYKIPGYYLYKSCASGYINIFNTFPYHLLKSIYTKGCYSLRRAKYQYLRNYVILNSIKKSINNAKYQLYKFFTPKGYIFEIRKKGDQIIINTTLGKTSGARPYEKVDIYTQKLVKILFSNKKTIEQIKIGEGIISNKINDKNCWVIVEKTNQPIKIGDYIKINYKFSFWKLFQ